MGSQMETIELEHLDLEANIGLHGKLVGGLPSVAAILTLFRISSHFEFNEMPDQIY